MSGCGKNPVKNLIFPYINDSKTWGNEWILYGGVDGLFGEDVRTKSWNPIWPFTDYWDKHPDEWSFDNTSEHHTGRTSILMKWNGDRSKSYDPQTFGQEVNYVGFLLQSEDPTTGIDISSGEYNYLKFWIKGNLTSGVILEVKTDASPGSILKIPILNNQWTEYKIMLTKRTDIISMASFSLSSVLQNNGGEVYIDDVRYTK
jgi:hypothetical protein